MAIGRNDDVNMKTDLMGAQVALVCASLKGDVGVMANWLGKICQPVIASWRVDQSGLLFVRCDTQAETPSRSGNVPPRERRP
jgi:hypothetical protein